MAKTKERDAAELKAVAAKLFSIKLHPAATNDPCPVCGGPTDAQPGPQLYAADAGPACAYCGWLYAVELMTLIELGRVADSSNPAGEFWRTHRAQTWGVPAT